MIPQNDLLLNPLDYKNIEENKIFHKSYFKEALNALTKVFVKSNDNLINIYVHVIVVITNLKNVYYMMMKYNVIILEIIIYNANINVKVIKNIAIFMKKMLMLNY